jgi:hypothetical protein
MGVLAAVRDSGSGHRSGACRARFEAFYTTKSSRMGMGLSICRSITDAHGGRLWADVNKPRGAIFQFTSPGAENELTNGEPREGARYDMSWLSSIGYAGVRGCGGEPLQRLLDRSLSPVATPFIECLPAVAKPLAKIAVSGRSRRPAAPSGRTVQLRTCGSFIDLCQRESLPHRYRTYA